MFLIILFFNLVFLIVEKYTLREIYHFNQFLNVQFSIIKNIYIFL